MNIPTESRLYKLENGFFYEIYATHDPKKFKWAIYEKTADGYTCHYTGEPGLHPNCAAESYWLQHKAELQAR